MTPAFHIPKSSDEIRPLRAAFAKDNKLDKPERPHLPDDLWSELNTPRSPSLSAGDTKP